MNTQSHAQIEADLKAFLDGELPFLRRQLVGRHIKNCPQCQQEIEFMQTIEKELDTATPSPLDTDLRAQIMESVPTIATPVQSTPTNKKAKKVGALKIGFGLAGVAFICSIVLFPTFGGRAPENARRSTPTQVEERRTMEKRFAVDESAGGNQNAVISGAAPDLVPAAPPEVVYANPNGNGIINGYRSNESRRTVDNYDFSSVVPQQRAVHREGSLTVTVDNAEAASAAVESIVKNTSGFVANNALSTATDGKRAATLDLRIPVADFEKVVEKVSKLGKVSAKSVSGEDITARVAKAGATKNTLSKELAIREAQLREKEKRAKKSDANALYYLRTEVRNLRVQASQARAQLETLQKFAALANLFVTLQDREKPVAPVGWTSDLNQTGNSAWSSFLGAAKLPIQLVIWVLAYSPLWIPVLIIWKKFGRRWLES